MKRILTLRLALLMQILAGCSTEVTEYRQQQPALDIFHYFQGRTEAWGMVQDRNGKQLRRFHVEIDGDVVGARAAAFEFHRGEGSGGRLSGITDSGVHEEPRRSSDR